MGDSFLGYDWEYEVRTNHSGGCAYGVFGILYCLYIFWIMRIFFKDHKGKTFVAYIRGGKLKKFKREPENICGCGCGRGVSPVNQLYHNHECSRRIRFGRPSWGGEK